MSENGDDKVLTPEASLLRCRELDRERESLVIRQAGLKERQAAAQRELQVLVEEMVQLGTTPQTIQADLTAASEKLVQETQVYEQQLAVAKKQLDQAESTLNQLEAQKGK
jgi:chromosome segregation ATPase